MDENLYRGAGCAGMSAERSAEALIPVPGGHTLTVLGRVLFEFATERFRTSGPLMVGCGVAKIVGDIMSGINNRSKETITVPLLIADLEREFRFHEDTKMFILSNHLNGPRRKNGKRHERAVLPGLEL